MEPISNSSDEAAVSSTDASSNSYSSSNDFAFTDSSSAEPAAPAVPAGGAAANMTTAARGSGRQYAFEAGGGFNAPIGNDIPYITWGGNFTVGGGLHLSPKPSRCWGNTSSSPTNCPAHWWRPAAGETGNAHIQSITIAPVIDLFPKRATASMWPAAAAGITSQPTSMSWPVMTFTDIPVFVTANSFSSNQGGVNLGFGFTHRLGGVYGDGTAKLFAEARYLWIDTPPIGEPNGLGTNRIDPGHRLACAGRDLLMDRRAICNVPAHRNTIR